MLCLDSDGQWEEWAAYCEEFGRAQGGNSQVQGEKAESEREPFLPGGDWPVRNWDVSRR